MRRTRVMFAAAILIGSVLVTTGVLTSSASANPACVTKAEFDKVSSGMTRDRVAQTFGTDGTFQTGGTMAGHTVSQRKYTPCVKDVSQVSVSYVDAKENSKTWKSR